MNLIACISKNYGIGYQDKLLFNIPEDMKHFKDLTINNIVIMGRKTLFTFKNKEPLPSRINVILTNNTKLKNDYKNYNDVFFTEDKESTLKLINILKKQYPEKEVFIIGGESIYNLFFNEINTCYITEVFEDKLCDTYLPKISEEEFIKTYESDIKNYQNNNYKFITYIRR